MVYRYLRVAPYFDLGISHHAETLRFTQMVQNATSFDHDSSSSCFSSDDETMDVSADQYTASLASSVHVEVLDEYEETGAKPPTIPAALQTPSASSNVAQCCRETLESIVQASKPIDVSYEQYTAAIEHVTSHWPAVSDVAELENKLKAYHHLRAKLYAVFQLAFPLTEDMYIQWIEDCRAKGDSIEELLRLYELAQADYWSVSLTLQYLNLIKEHQDTAALDMAMEKAQTTMGTHFTRGHEVWARCRELTIAIFDEKDEHCELEKEQRIRDLFSRQMQVPLDQNDLVLSEFRAWTLYNTRDIAASKCVFEAAVARQTKVFAPFLKKLKGFEAAVNGVDDLEQKWLQYLNFVKHRVAPLLSSDGTELVVCLYERAVARLCLSSKLWVTYLDFIESKGLQSKLKVAQRAVRNVPFDSFSWTEALIAMEQQSMDVTAISRYLRTELIERASVPMGELHLLNTLLTWCDVARRQAFTTVNTGSEMEAVETMLEEIFQECHQLLAKAYPKYVEGALRLAEYHAQCCWTLVIPGRSLDARVAKVKDLWQQTLSTLLGDYAATWIAYYNALQQMNVLSVENIRLSVFDEAVKRVKDMPLALADAWLVFERQYGDLTHYLCARRLHRKHSAFIVTPVDIMVFEGDTKPLKSKKRKAIAVEQPAKQCRTQRPKMQNVALLQSNETTAKSSSNAKKSIHKSLTNEHTLFLCNVSKDASQGEIEEMFREIPTLKEVRLVVKTRGERMLSRGMAYVQFTNEEGVEAGLRRDGFLLHGHALRVKRSQPPVASASKAGKTSNGEGFCWNYDPLTLYIGNLNQEQSTRQVSEQELQEALQQSMQQVGELVVVTRVSILRDRHGKWKNYGLVQVAEASQVAVCLANVAALQGMLGNQVTMKASRFSIAHMLEQQAKQHSQKRARQAECHSTNVPHMQRHKVIGSATSLMPRVLRRKAAVSIDASKASKVAKSGALKTNEDFRKMIRNS
ncbi:hypothetical protein CCR75_008626 [Bremia lactucae]|uniref:RRM domain-containing protein n=1 Tax=Bremia lactucae TaxID=4779 RepID=A0A976FIK3_BRELC|nr:hypothetical protein CCR75_008626 [Bremia lactucae]